MRISQRDAKLLFVLGGLLIFLILYMGVVTPLQEKTEQVQADIEVLAPELAALEAYQQELPAHERETAQLAETLQAELARYPAAVKEEDFLVYLLDLEAATGAVMDSVTFTAPEIALQFPCIVQQDGKTVTADVTAYRTGVTMTNALNYPQLKHSLAYIYDSPMQAALDEVSVSYNAETGNLNGSFTLSRSAISWSGAEYIPAELPAADKGVFDPFGTT